MAPKPRPRVALATCAALPDGDADDGLLPAALERLGIEANWQRWDDAAVGWDGFDAVLVRSTWDYQERREEFLAWARGQRLLINPTTVLEWNTDKRYLAELEAAGLPVVATVYIEQGDDPAAELAGTSEVVVKPSVSAGSRDTARFRLDEEGELHRASALIAAIHADGKTAMVQPYLSRVDERGETALVYIGGEFSHSVRKGPLLRPGAGPTEEVFAPETIEPRPATAAERDLGDRVIAEVATRFGRLAYARVDVIEADDGSPVVLELELTEPSLFLSHAEGAADRLAAEVAARLEGPGPAASGSR